MTSSKGSGSSKCSTYRGDHSPGVWGSFGLAMRESGEFQEALGKTGCRSLFLTSVFLGMVVVIATSSRSVPAFVDFAQVKRPFQCYKKLRSLPHPQKATRCVYVKITGSCELLGLFLEKASKLERARSIGELRGQTSEQEIRRIATRVWFSLLFVLFRDIVNT